MHQLVSSHHTHHQDTAGNLLLLRVTKVRSELLEILAHRVSRVSKVRLDLRDQQERLDQKVIREIKVTLVQLELVVR
jgi:hypothetical protein